MNKIQKKYLPQFLGCHRFYWAWDIISDILAGFQSCEKHLYLNIFMTFLDWHVWAFPTNIVHAIYLILSTYRLFLKEHKKVNQIIKREIILRLGAQSVTLLSTLRDPTQLRRRQWEGKKLLKGFREFRTYFWEVDHPPCDVWKQKTQILIAHQKEDIERTQKSPAIRQKKFS